MTDRVETTLRYLVKGRMVEIKVMDSVAAEDAFNTYFRAVLHRYLTGEDVVAPVPREIKDWIVKLNLTV